MSPHPKYGFIPAFLALFTLTFASPAHALPPTIPPIPAVPASDAGDHAWARQVIPALLGRKPRGVNEIKLVADIAGQIGRSLTAKVLMDTDDFRAHWLEIFVDHLHINREPPELGNPKKYQLGCFDMPRLPGSPTRDLALYIQQHAAFIDDGQGANSSNFKDAQGVHPFTMIDVIQSSLVLDDVSPIYRAYLFPLVNQPVHGAQTTELNRRADIGAQFNSVYLDRDFGCVGCHSSQHSVTKGGAWPRHFPIGGAFETALFGFNSNPKGSPSPTALNPVGHFAFFNTLIAFKDKGVFTPPIGEEDLVSVCSGGVNQAQSPWGQMYDGANVAAAGSGCGRFCVTLAQDDTFDKDPKVNAIVAPFFAQEIGAMADRRRSTVWALDEKLKSGADALRRDPLHYQSDLGINIDGLWSKLDPNEAFAFLTAVNIVDQIWTEVMGSPLVVQNHFPRNEAQRDLLWSLTQNELLTHHGFSLKGVLSAIVSSDYFNRKPPAEKPNDIYDLPMVADPWVAYDPRPQGAMPDPSGNDTHNAMSDFIHRYGWHSLLYATSKAMGWPAPRRFPDSNPNTYPSKRLTVAMGQYYADDQPGDNGIGLDAILQWEDAHGACQNVAANQQDYIWQLVNTIKAVKQSGGSATYQEAIEALKAWLLGVDTLGGQQHLNDATNQQISESELLDHLLQAKLNVHLGDPIGSLPDLEAELREICGVMLQSPQFLLAGVAESQPPGEPRFRDVCPTGVCTYTDMCNELASKASPPLRLDWDCTGPQVLVGVKPIVTLPFCPPWLCHPIEVEPPIPSWPVHPWLLSPGSDPRDIPNFDPRCFGGATCASRPVHGPADLLLLWGEGGILAQAGGVLYLPTGGAEATAAQQGITLHPGDVLFIPTGGMLDIALDGEHVQTGAAGAPAYGTPAQSVYWTMMITGPSALAPASPPPDPPPSASMLQELLSRPWLSSGVGPGVCDGADLRVDPSNCGRCGVSCPSGFCFDGLCGPAELATGQTGLTALVVDDREVYWTTQASTATQGSATARKTTKWGGSYPDLLHSDNGYFPGIALDADRIYLTHQGATPEVLSLSRFDGSSAATTLTAGESSPSSIAVDPRAGMGRVFWSTTLPGSTATASPTGQLRASSKSGSEIATLAGGGELGPFARNADHLFWVSPTDGSVLSLPFSGEIASVVATGGGSPTRLAASAGAVAWIDGSNGAIWVQPLSGPPASAPRIDASTTSAPFDIAIDDTWVYWSEHLAGKISRVRLEGNESPVVLFTDTSAPPRFIAVDEDSLYWSNSQGSIFRLPR